MPDNNRRKTKNSVRREGRAQAATKHIAEMDARFGADIACSLAELTYFDAAPEASGEMGVPKVSVVDKDSVAAVLEMGRGLASACDLAVLDFASFTHPGGGYDSGAWAQEEALCAESTLYNVLREQKAWYLENRKRNINCALYRNRAFVVPKVRFERNQYHSYADVIVAAAPNLRRARSEYNVDDKTAFAAMQSRIRLVLAIADTLGHKKLVLGAFGCGVFGWNSSEVAEMFRQELASGTHVAQEVVFAVPKGRDENLERFEHAFACFPEKNTVAYVDRSTLEKAQEADVLQEAEEEDDWRKYLG